MTASRSTRPASSAWALRASRIGTRSGRGQALLLGAPVLSDPHAEGLASIIGEYFDLPAQVEQFVGQCWRSIARVSCSSESPRRRARSARPPSWAPASGTVSRSSGFARPMEYTEYEHSSGRPAPAAARLLVKSYIGNELSFDVRLVLKASQVPQPASAASAASVGLRGWLQIARAGCRRPDPSSAI